jgi:hypothetical protein
MVTIEPRSMPTSKLTHEIITAAIDGFEAQKKRIDSQIAELRQMLNAPSSEASAAPESKPRKRRIGAAVRRRMAEAQRKRWAAAKNESHPQSPAGTPEAAKPKRRLSAAGRKRIVEATKRRWARIRAEQATKKATGKTTAAPKRGKKGKGAGATRNASAVAGTGD